MLALVATSCGLLSSASNVVSSSSSSTQSGKLVGNILKSIYDQYSTDGTVDTSNVSNIVNMAQLAGILSKVKNLTSGTQEYADFAEGLITGSSSLISSDNSSTVIKALSSLGSKVDLSSLAGLATKASAKAAATEESTSDIVETAKTVTSIMKVLGK